MPNSYGTYLKSAVAASALLLPVVAHADTKLAAPKPVVVEASVAQPLDWTGFYGGLSVGIGRDASGTDITRRPDNPFWTVSPRASGRSGALRVGYDHQFDGFVVGGLAELHFGRFSASEEHDGSGPPAEPRVRYSGLMSVALRGGPVVNDGQTLVYGRIGVSRAKLKVDNVAGEGPWDPLVAEGTGTSKTSTGLNIGFGVEHRLGRNISVVAEYNFHNVGSRFDIVPTSGPDHTWRVKGRGLHVASIGLNYRF